MNTSILDTIKPQYIVDNNGNKTGVVLDVQTFTSMIEELEDLYDIMQAEKILIQGESEEGKTLDEIEESIRKGK